MPRRDVRAACDQPPSVGREGRMRLERNVSDVVIVLSRRNLLTLLAKLDEHPKGSLKQIVKVGHNEYITVKAEEDESHYSDRQPGRMHPETEAAIQQRVSGQ